MSCSVQSTTTSPTTPTRQPLRKKGAPPPFVSRYAPGGRGGQQGGCSSLLLHGTHRPATLLIGSSGTHLRVFKQFDEKRQHDVALRVTALLDRPLSPITVSKVQEECRRFEALDNENVVKVFGCHYDRDRHSCTLSVEFMEQGSVYAKMKLLSPDASSSSCRSCSREPLSEEKMWYIVKPIIDGLQYLHNNGIVHGDIRETSILLDSNGRPKLSGACTSERLLRSVEPGRSFCEPVDRLAFSPPEELRGGNPTLAASDIWSLACVIVMLATGELPWNEVEATTHGMTLYQRLQAGVHPTIPSHLSNGLKQLLVAMFDKVPEKRPTSTQLLESEYFNCEGFRSDVASKYTESVRPTLQE